MKKSMLAAFFEGPGKLTLKNIDTPKLIPGSALLQIKSCALCGSDIRTYFHGNKRVPVPQILGHEVSGEIVAVDKEVTTLKVGDRISLAADIPCNNCPYCKRGLTNCCKENLAVGYQIPGGFAQYMLLPPRLIDNGPWEKISSSLSYEVASLAEPLACCLNGMAKLDLKKEHSVLILGSGPIGIILGLLAKKEGVKEVILTDYSNQRLALAGKDFTLVNPDLVDIKKFIWEKTEGLGVDRILTACSDISSHELSLELISKQGVINFFGGLPKNSRFLNISSNFLHYNEVSLTGSHGCTPQQHKKAIELLEKGEIDLAPLITHTFPLKEIHQAFELAQQKTGLKVIIHPGI